MEDTGHGAENLRALGFSEEALDALKLMTHDDAVTYGVTGNYRLIIGTIRRKKDGQRIPIGG